MRKYARLVFTLLVVVATLIALFLAFYVSTEELMEVRLKQFQDCVENSDKLVVSLIGTDHVLATIRETNAIRRFVDLVDFEEDVGAVMSSGIFRFVFFEGSEPVEIYQLVLGDYFRHEGGSDYQLSEQSSRAIKQWLADYGSEK